MAIPSSAFRLVSLSRFLHLFFVVNDSVLVVNALDDVQRELIRLRPDGMEQQQPPEKPQPLVRIQKLKCTPLPLWESQATTATSRGGSIDGSFKCEFVVVPSKPDVRLDGQETGNSDNGAIEEEICDENNRFCMRARVTKFTPASFVSAQEEEEKLLVLHGEIAEPIAQPEPATTTYKTPVKRPTSSSSSSSRERVAVTAMHPSSFWLREFYPQPYDQYGAMVEAVLTEWLLTDAVVAAAEAALDDGSTATKTPVQDVEDTYVMAEWIRQIGLAHRSEAELLRQPVVDEGEARIDARKQVENANLLKQVNWAVRAFRQALQYYEGIGQVDDDDDTDSNNRRHDDPWFPVLKQLHMAIVYCHIAEVLVLSQDSKQADLDKDYYLQAHRLFSNFKIQLIAPAPSLESMKTDFPYLYEQEEEQHLGGERGAVRSIQAFWREARLAWGQANLRLGVIELSSYDPALDLDLSLHDEDGMADWQTVVMDLLQTTTGGGVNELNYQHAQEGSEKLQQTLGDLIQHKIPKFLESSERAETYFQSAAGLFRQILSESPGGEEDYDVKLHLGSALQNLGTTSISKGDTEQGIQHLEGALETFRSAINTEDSSYEQQGGDLDPKQNAGELMYSLSKSYLEKGNYEMAHSYYHRAMKWYVEHELPPTDLDSAVDSFVDSTGSFSGLKDSYAQSIQEFERALEQYQDMFSAGGVGVNEEDLGGGGPYYAKNDGYEADLHNGLGTMYMATGDVLEAMVHITQALLLYSRTGEQRQRHFADLKLNQAFLFYRLGQFSESATAHYEALEIYRATSGDGVNPLLGNGMLDMASLRSMMEEAQHSTKLAGEQATASGKPNGQVRDADTAAQNEAIDVRGDGTESLRVIIRPLKLPMELANETEIDEVVPLLGAQ